MSEQKPWSELRKEGTLKKFEKEKQIGEKVVDFTPLPGYLNCFDYAEEGGGFYTRSCPGFLKMEIYYTTETSTIPRHVGFEYRAAEVVNGSIVDATKLEGYFDTLEWDVLRRIEEDLG